MRYFLEKKKLRSSRGSALG